MPYDPTGSGFQVVEGDDVTDETLNLSTEKRETIEQFLSLAQMRFRTVVEAETVLRQHMLEDLRFRASEQWPDNVRSMREKDGRPCLTVNRIPQFVRQVTNNQRASRPAIAVNPTGDRSDPDVAEVIQGVVRHIENKSDADAQAATTETRTLGDKTYTYQPSWWKNSTVVEE